MAPRWTPRRHLYFGDLKSRGLLFGPDAGVQRFRLVLKQRSEHLGRSLSAPEYFAAGKIERRILRMISGNGTQSMFAQPVDQPADAGPVDCARTHRTGFGGRVKRGTAEDIRAECRAGLRREQAFGVGRAVASGRVAVLGFDQNVAVPIDENGAE